MNSARHFNEDLGDVDSAILLWSEVCHRSPDADGPNAVTAIMMSVASKRGHSSLSREERDMAGALRIYEAVHRFRRSADQDQRVVRTMMDVANRLTDLSRSWSEMDIDSAVAIWTSLYRLEVSTDDRLRLVRTMMDVANRLTDLRDPGRPTDIPGAIRIWRAIGDLPVSMDDRKRVVLTMLGLATRLSDRGATKSERDFGAAILLWQAAWRLARAVDADLGLQVVRTMMDVANMLSDLSGDREVIDIDAAIRVWSGIVEASADPEDRDRAVKTMMAQAHRFLGEEAWPETGGNHSEVPPQPPSGGLPRSSRAKLAPDSVLAALKLYHACWCCSPSGLDRLRVTKTLFDTLPRIPGACPMAITALRGERASFPDLRFRSLVEAGLFYYQEDFEVLVALVESNRSPSAELAALRADALRKLHRLDEAIDACSRLLARSITTGDDAILDRDARVSAMCCRGYCHLEKGRTEARFLERAIADLQAAARDAERWGVPVPPRVYTGLGYVFRIQGRDGDAAAAFDRAMRIDHDNRKGIEAVNLLPQRT